MPVVRTFIAVLLTAELRSKIVEVQEQFRAAAPRVKWVAEGNLHVTLKFLGDVGDDRLGEICAALEKATVGASPFRLVVSGAGAFPNLHRPRVVWIGLGSGADSLTAIAGNVESELAALGYSKEERPFSAHITIGRVRPETRVDDLTSAMQTAGIAEIGDLEVKSIALMKSDLRREGPVYSILKEITFDRPQGGSGF